MFTEARPDSDPTATPRGSAAIEDALKSIPGAVLMVDTELRYLAVGGRAVAEILSVHGQTAQALVGMCVPDVIHPEYQEARSSVTRRSWPDTP